MNGRGMARKLQARRSMRASLLLVVLTTTMSAFVGGAIAQQRGDTPSTVKEVMTAVTIPSSDEIFAAASDPPSTDKGWTDVRAAALRLSESGKLLMTARLAKDKGAWMDMARALVAEAEATAQIAGAKDRPALEQAADKLYATCETCHTRYLPGAQ